MALVALDDAEALSTTERARLQSYLIDGKAARFQTWALVTTPRALQPPELVLIREALRSTDGDLLWRGAFALATGTRPDLPASRFFTESVGPVAAEDRPAWALLAWHLGIAPGGAVIVGMTSPLPALLPLLRKITRSIALLTPTGPIRSLAAICAISALS